MTEQAPSKAHRADVGGYCCLDPVGDDRRQLAALERSSAWGRHQAELGMSDVVFKSGGTVSRTDPAFVVLRFSDANGITDILRLPAGNALAMASAIAMGAADYARLRSHSDTSSGMPSSDGSPIDGQKHPPSATASAALCADG